jgi:hypothetical protein
MGDNYKGFPKGVSGNPIGRPKGSKNKVRYDVAEILKAEGCNPFKILAQIALGNTDYSNGKPIGVFTRKEAASDLASYVAPKLKSIELTGEERENFAVFLNMSSKLNTDNVDKAIDDDAAE